LTRKLIGVAFSKFFLYRVDCIAPIICRKYRSFITIGRYSVVVKHNREDAVCTASLRL
jgi:hypothetical protein